MRKFREAKKLTQKQLGERVNASERQIGYWEKGGGMSLEQAYNVTAILGCTLDELVGRKVPAFIHSDPGQNALNASYGAMNETGKETLVKVARSMEKDTANRIEKDGSEHMDDTALQGA
jgi:transcriptional regulator with XRE-family HTH domain